MHLAEPGCLCTKAGIVSCACKAGAGLEENRPLLTASGVGTRSPSHLNHCCFMRKGLEFAPQQMPGTQSQLGGLVGLVGGRRRKPDGQLPEWD